MRMIGTALLATLFIGETISAGDFSADRLNNWHQWRGPEANGTAPTANPPIQWDEQTNIRWKTDLPGEGTATPIVWGDRIFIVTAIKTDRTGEPAVQPQEKQDARSETGTDGKTDDKPDAAAPLQADQGAPQRRGSLRVISRPSNYHQFVVVCIERATGMILWQKIAREEVPHEGHHPDHGFASASPTTDGKLLYVSFGSRGIYCYHLDGNLRWERDLGDMRTRLSFGEGSSPTLYGDSLIVTWDHEGPSFITALDAATGETRWQVDRDEPSNWSTPLVVPHNGRTQVIVNGTNRARSYDLATGELIWQCGGQTMNAIPAPVRSDALVYCMSGLRGKAVFAIPLDASGELTDTDRIAWQNKQISPYVPSPLVLDERIYFTDSNRPLLCCLDAKTGEVLMDRVRLPGLNSLYASALGAGGKIYLVGRDGTALVIKQATELEVLATNKLDEPIDASPVAVGKELFLRGMKHLYCIAQE